MKKEKRRGDSGSKNVACILSVFLFKFSCEKHEKIIQQILESLPDGS